MSNWWENAPIVQAAPNHQPAPNAVPAYSAAEKWWQDAPLADATPKPVSNHVQSSADAAILGTLDQFTGGGLDEVASGIDYLLDKLPERQGRTYDEILAQARREQKGAEETYPVSYMGGQVVGGVAQAAVLAGTGLSAATQAQKMGFGVKGMTLGSAVDGYVTGLLHGFGSGEGLDDRRQKGWDQGWNGGLFGAAMPGAVAAVMKTAQKFVTPFATSASRAAAAGNLRAEGIPLTAGQVTGSRPLRYAEAELAPGHAAAIMDKQRTAFTRAVLRRVGVDADRASPEVINEAFTRLGKQFDDLSAQNHIGADYDLLTALRGIADDYGDVVAESSRAPIVESTVEDVFQALSTGKLSGKVYHGMASRLDKAARSTKDQVLKGTLLDLRHALDDAMERSIAANNPKTAFKWRETRRHYSNLLTVEDAATRAGEGSAEGIISPAAIRGATVKQGKHAYADGEGDFARLARDGNIVMTPLPDSGTAGRLSPKNAGALGMTLLEASAGSQAGLSGLLFGGLFRAAAAYALGRALLSKPVQSYLSNQAFAAPLETRTQALISALMNGGASPATH